MGALLGALGVPAMLPFARRFGASLAGPITLPGAERLAGDVKLATYAEAALLLLGVPAAALLFGRVIPTILEHCSRAKGLSFQWTAGGLASSLPLWLGGLRPKWAVSVGLFLSAAIAGGILLFRSSFTFRRFLTRRGRHALLSLFGAGAAAGLAGRASFRASPLTGVGLLSWVVGCGIALAAAGLLVSLGSGGGVCNLGRMGEAAYFSLVLSGASLFFARTWVVAATALTLPLVSIAFPFRRVFLPGLRLFSVAFLLSCCGWSIYWRPASEVDLFEDGHALALAQQSVRGAHPFRDTYPVHGWGADGGVDAFCFRLFGPSLEVFRVRRALFAALTLAALAVSVAELLGSAAWAAVGVVFALSICPFVSERQLLPLAALALLVHGARFPGRRAVSWTLAGALGGLALLFSLDMGLILVVGALLGVSTLPSAESQGWRLQQGIRSAGWFLAGLALACLPFLIRLSILGSLSAFARVSFVELPREISATWGLPAGSPAHLMGPAMSETVLLEAWFGSTVRWVFWVVLLAAVGAVLLVRAASARLEGVDRAAWVWAGVAFVSVRGMLGRADEGHAALYGLLGAPLASWLLLRTVRSPLRLVASLMVGLVLLARLRPLESLRAQAEMVASSARLREQEAWGSVSMFRTGRARIPITQARELSRLREFLDGHLAPAETFFDFSNEPALYFLLDRKMPTRFLSVPSYETQEKQNEVVADLERVKPPLAILAAGSWLDAPDGVSNRDRAPLVASYLDSHYGVAEKVGAWTIGCRRKERGSLSGGFAK